MPVMSTDEWMNGEKRPESAGLVTIVTEEILHVQDGKIVRPTCVTGIVWPHSTAGRGSAPEPSTGIRVSTAALTSSEQPLLNQRNTGIVDADKGHIMALELGGPDIPENIVPQWSNFQRNGAWKLMENDVRKDALRLRKTKQKLLFLANVTYKHYNNLSTASSKSLRFPSGFTVYTFVQNEDGTQGGAQKVFDSEQAQNETDYMMAARQMQAADGISYMDLYDDVTEKSAKSKKKPAKLVFVSSGQNPLYGAPAVTYSLSSSQMSASAMNLVFNAQVVAKLQSPAPAPAPASSSASASASAGMDTGK